MINILYISPALSVKGGISTVVKSYLELVDSDRFNIIQISSHKDGSRLYKLLVAVLGVLKLGWVLLTTKIDIVHIHGSDIISSLRKYVYYRFIRQLSRSKIIYHFHGADFEKQYDAFPEILRRRVAELFAGCDLILCLSKSWREKILQLVPDAKITIITNAVMLPHIDVHDRCKEKLEITFLGLIGERKGVFDLLNVVRELREEGYSFLLNIGGNGEVEKLKKQISDFKLHECVKYLGWVSEEEREQLFRKTDIYILPSYGEGLPMSVLEAMSYGVPVISTFVGGLPELISNGDNGFLFKPGNLHDLKRLLSLLIEDQNLRSNLGRNARLTIEKKHNLCNSIEKLSDIYLKMG